MNSPGRPIAAADHSGQIDYLKGLQAGKRGYPAPLILRRLHLKSNAFDDRSRGHAVTDAHGLHAILRLAALQLVDQLGHQDGAGRAAAGVVPSVRICQTIRLPICRFAS